MRPEFAAQLVVAAVIGAASGAIGSFIVVRRMALVGDALSHVALPGIALAIAYRLDPIWGVVGVLVVAAFVIWWLQWKSRLPVDAIVGLLFTASLAIGILTIPNADILESLFGAFPALSPAAFAGTVGAAILALLITVILARKFLYAIVSQDLARIGGVGRGYDLALLLLFSIVVALGIKRRGDAAHGGAHDHPGRHCPESFHRNAPIPPCRYRHRRGDIDRGGRRGKLLVSPAGTRDHSPRRSRLCGDIADCTEAPLGGTRSFSPIREAARARPDELAATPGAIHACAVSNWRILKPAPVSRLSSRTSANSSRATRVKRQYQWAA